jgi:hypothetical protein
MVVLTRMIALIAVITTLVIIFDVKVIAATLMLGALALIDFVMVLGYCLRKPRVLAFCYVLNVLSVVTLVTLGIL